MIIEWTKIDSGLGWSKYGFRDYVIEPEDLDLDEWSLWKDTDHIASGSLSELKDHAQTIFNSSIRD